MSRPTPKAFADLLASAVHEPGTLSQAYRQFHHYSLGNQLLAMFQCAERGIAPGPINTFPGWKTLRRHVRKGETAITLCMPITVKRKRVEVVPDADEPSDITTRFVYKPRWFVVSQTHRATRLQRQWSHPGTERRRSAGSTSPRSRSTTPTGTAWALRGTDPSPSTRSTRCRTRRGFTSWRMCSSATRPQASRLTRRSPRATCASVRPNPSPCCAVRPSTCRVSPSVAATSSRGGARGTRSPSRPHDGCSESPIRSSRRGRIRGCCHEGGALRPREHPRPGARKPARRAATLYAGPRVGGDRVRRPRGLGGQGSASWARSAGHGRQATPVRCPGLLATGSARAQSSTPDPALGRPPGHRGGVWSLAEGIDATTPAGRLQLHILGAIAEFERARIAERVRAGLARARAQGKTLGRPRKSTRVTVPHGLTVRGAAQAWGVSKSTAATWLNAGRIPGVGQTSSHVARSDHPATWPPVFEVACDQRARRGYTEADVSCTSRSARDARDRKERP